MARALGATWDLWGATLGRTDTYRRQHDDIIALLDQLAALLQPDALARNAMPARTKLAVLAGKLKVHLVMEDERLYPAAMRSEVPELVALAKRFQLEMGGISSAFDAYLTKWASAALIQESPLPFIADTQAIQAALQTRIGKENHELYPLMEGVTEAI